MEKVFIVNEKANNGKNVCLEEKIRENTLQAKIFSTLDEAGLRDILRFYKDRDSLVYAVGGDGTVNRVLNGIYGGEASLGIIPAGTGNDFYRKLNRYYEDMLYVNVMQVNDQVGINSFSVGVDAMVCANAKKMKKIGVPSDLVYLCSIVYTFFKYRNEKVQVNEEEFFVTLLALCNGTYYGGGFALAPDADVMSDSLSAYFLHGVNRFSCMDFLYRVVQGKHMDYPYLERTLVDKTLKIQASHDLVGQLDGEILVTDSFTVHPSVGRIKVVNDRALVKKLMR